MQRIRQRVGLSKKNIDDVAFQRWAAAALKLPLKLHVVLHSSYVIPEVRKALAFSSLMAKDLILQQLKYCFCDYIALCLMEI